MSWHNEETAPCLLARHSGTAHFPFVGSLLDSKKLANLTDQIYCPFLHDTCAIWANKQVWRPRPLHPIKSQSPVCTQTRVECTTNQHGTKCCFQRILGLFAQVASWWNTHRRKWPCQLALNPTDRQRPMRLLDVVGCSRRTKNVQLQSFVGACHALGVALWTYSNFQGHHA